MAIIRKSVRRFCGGSATAAALLNELVFIRDCRIRAGEPEWFQRKAAYWIDALEGVSASEKTIRKGFGILVKLRFVEVRDERGNQRGSWYRVNGETLQTALDHIGKDPATVADEPSIEPEETPGKTTRVKPTPAESTDHPGTIPDHPGKFTDHVGKNDRGSCLLYTRAGEPLQEPFENQTDREPDLSDSPYDEKTDWDRLLQAIHTIPKFKTSTRRGQKWEQKASESGVAPDILAQVIERYGDELAVGCDSPVWLIQKAAELIESGRSGIKVPVRWTVDSVMCGKVAARYYDDDAWERLERMSQCGLPEIESEARTAILWAAGQQFHDELDGRLILSDRTMASLKFLTGCGDHEIEERARKALQRIEAERAGRGVPVDDTPAKDASEVGSPPRGSHSGQGTTSKHGNPSATAERVTDDAQRAYQRLAEAPWSDRYGEFGPHAVAA